MAKSNVITNIESKTKATRSLSFLSLIFFIGYMLMAYAFRKYVNDLLVIPYMIFNAVMCIFLLMPSGCNKGRNNLESIYILFTGDSTVYRPYYEEKNRGV